MNWFYDKQVTFQCVRSGKIGDDGLYNANETIETLTVNCDVQPVSHDDLVDDSGQYLDAQYKVYCDADSFIKGCSTLIYKDVAYSIKQVIDWDDYFIVFIKAVG